MWKVSRDTRRGIAALSHIALGLGIALLGCGENDSIEGRLSRLSPTGEDGPELSVIPDAGATMAAPVCGNARVEPGETCDGTPGCDPNCQYQVSVDRCGDTRLTPPEECDDGNDSDVDGCSSRCQLIECGNGRVDPGESCDRLDATCDADCQTLAPAPVSCGNGSPEGAEECDDGNVESNDGCAATCLLEICGNARLDALETCDPPDSVVCSAACQHMSCGDGRKEGNEACDDGNLDAGDGCNAMCQAEACGNGRLEPHEDCEPPRTPTCDAQCRAVRVECGDGQQHPTEECDDGNLAFGDTCSPSCQREACGNGRVEAPREQCEPPGTATCTALCRRPRCGDGELTRPSESCEDGNADNGDGCSATCRLEFCGNGALDAPEQCEPPGTASCDQRCQSIGVTTLPDLDLPIGRALFELQNPDFDGSLQRWVLIQPASGSVLYSPFDWDGAPTSGSAELSASEFVARGLAAGVSQCVRSAPGATYQMLVGATAVSTNAAGRVQLRATFHRGATCAGGRIDGVTAVYPVSAAWAALRLPPASPIPEHPSSFATPLDAGSMSISLELSGDPGEAASSVRLDRVELVRVNLPRCGDGIPEGDEQCEPSLTAGCTAGCELPASCGDGLPGPDECGESQLCPEDCPSLPAVCGDEEVSPPEECDPPGLGSCSEHCTVLHALCGNGQMEPGEECDPPNGWTCSAECESIRCGNGVVEDREQCEPPGTAECSARCESNSFIAARCGDGLLTGAEECDPPNAATWCSSQCVRRNPLEACGDGRVDLDLGEQCDPPSHDNNCGIDCRTPVCGDGTIGGREQCEPSGMPNDPCGADCRYAAGAGRECYDCLATTCSPPDPEPDLFSDCFNLQGVAASGTAVGRPLRDLCVEAVECMRQTACDSEKIGTGRPNPLACYCGKSVLSQNNEPIDWSERLRYCRDGLTPARGACREEFERAAEAAVNPAGRPSPASVVAAATGLTPGKPALIRAIRLMTECGHAPGECGEECAVVPRCGDGVVGSGEACDPEDPETREHCHETICSILPCGNGIIDEGETCDVADPYTSGRCSTSCQILTECGDGRLTQGAEPCDGSAPGESWANCCRWIGLGEPAHPSHLEACDHDRSGQIDELEGCRFPQICGNGRQEGAEQCDDGGAIPVPPDVDRCDDNCERIFVDPCSRCANTELNCGSQYEACFDNPQPSLKAACGAVFGCIETSDCVSNGGSIEPCLCGGLSGFDCATAGLGVRNGPCVDIMTQHSGCPPADPACVWSQWLNPAFATGLATQVVQCGLDLCSDVCTPAAP